MKVEQSTGLGEARGAMTWLARRTARLEALMMVAPVVGALTGVILARGLGPEGRGQVAVMTVGAGAVTAISTLSIDKGIAHVAKAEAVAPAQVLVTTRKLLALSCMLAGCLGAIWGWIVGVPLSITILLSLGAAVGVWAEYLMGISMGQRRTREIGVWRILVPVVWLVGVIAALASSHLSGYNPVVAVGVGFLMSLLIPTLWLRGKVNAHSQSPAAPVPGLDKSVLRFALRYHLSSLSVFLSTRLDLLVAPLLLSLAEVGIYAVASAPALLLLAPRGALYIRGFSGTRSPGWRWWSVFACTSVLFILALPKILPVVFGQAFASAVLPAQVLCVGVLLELPLAVHISRVADAGRPLSTVMPAVGLVLGMATFVTFMVVATEPSVLAIACGVTMARVLAGAGATVWLMNRRSRKIRAKH